MKLYVYKVNVFIDFIDGERLRHSIGWKWYWETGLVWIWSKKISNRGYSTDYPETFAVTFSYLFTQQGAMLYGNVSM